MQNASRQGRQVIARDFFVYQENFLALASGATATGSINIQADSDFLLEELTFFADIAGAAQTSSSRVIPLVTVQISDTGSGRNLLESQVPIPSIFGTGERPFILPNPKLLAANSNLSLSVTNYDAAAEYNLRCSLIGTKIFYGA